MPTAVSPSRNIELLLAENVPNLGQQGEIVSVKPGYARNYLLPQGLATIATAHNKRMVEQHRIRLEQLETDRLKSIKDLANNVNKYSVTMEANANQEGHLYGSITAPEISKALKAANYDVEPEHIKLEGPLKELGMYTVKLEFHEKIKTEVKVWV
ncbi:MAG: 50S ribosomal protein L9, partial [Planctomyces sp.]|nr:50S ribosomal protein L9 [Planctomyces sp.]